MVNKEANANAIQVTAVVASMVCVFYFALEWFPPSLTRSPGSFVCVCCYHQKFFFPPSLPMYRNGAVSCARSSLRFLGGPCCGQSLPSSRSERLCLSRIISYCFSQLVSSRMSFDSSWWTRQRIVRPRCATLNDRRHRLYTNSHFNLNCWCYAIVIKDWREGRNSFLSLLLLFRVGNFRNFSPILLLLVVVFTNCVGKVLIILKGEDSVGFR